MEQSVLREFDGRQSLLSILILTEISEDSPGPHDFLESQ